MTSEGKELQMIQPPKGSFCGTPSSVTRARPAPEPAMERSDTPCTEGLADRLELRRNKERPGTWRNAASSWDEICNCCSSSSVVENAALPTGSGGRAVMSTCSGAWVLSPARTGDTSMSAVEHKAAVFSSLRTAVPSRKFRGECPRNFNPPSRRGWHSIFTISESPHAKFAHFEQIRYSRCVYLREKTKAGSAWRRTPAEQEGSRPYGTGVNFWTRL